MSASKPQSTTCGGGDGGCAGTKYRSIISDVFDGKLLSSVQCLICDRVSTRVETFQDLSLPIPSREHLAVIRCQQPPSNPQNSTHESWLWWVLGWLRSWLYGPVVSLQDCLAAFFSADELKGDNMYSCSRCNKLRNGVKMSGVVRLPEVLCVHLKRFRHELMFSAKVAARVSFPLRDLDMSPYTHKECTSKISRYELCAVDAVLSMVEVLVKDQPDHDADSDDVEEFMEEQGLLARLIHHFKSESADQQYLILSAARKALQGGGARRIQHTFPPIIFHAYRLAYTYKDLKDQEVIKISLIYFVFLVVRKVNPQMAVLRQKAAEILESTSVEPNDIKFYVSKQWINKFNTWAEPGPIDNSDFVCCHGGVRPDRGRHLPHLVACLPQPLWEFLYAQFGGGPAVSHVHECGVCARAAQRLRTRRARELAAFCDLHAIFQEQERPRAIYAISMHWFRQWQAFVRNKTPQPPPPVDNTGIVTTQEVDGKTTHTLKQGSDHAQLSEELWRFFTDTYGGGPEVKLRAPMAPLSLPRRNPPTTPHSESDREDYCTNSDFNIRESIQNQLQKNQSLQNINRRHRRTDSDDDPYKYYRRQEPNGNYDSDEEMDTNPPQNYVNAVRIENGVDGSSDHDANDNPVTDADLPNLDSISLKTKWSKSGKVRKTKRRTVK
ncbi:hypothetical protein evm_009659 [Chilo suppressalis]|nr:hypothetical protein evm_009659 [Chilo suppressalis]